MRRQQGFLIYDSISDRYYIDYHQTLSILANELLLELLLAARSYMKGRLLDVGCGKRPYALIYNRLVEQSVGTEVPFSLHGVHAADLLCFAEQLPFADSTFDTILCTEVLEHTQSPFQVMHELARLLVPGGHLILSVPFIYPIHEAPFDHWRFTAHGLVRMCEDVGLKLVGLHSKGGIIVTMLVLTHNITVRMITILNRIFHLDPPLYYRPQVRWLLCLPQWWYLRGSHWLRYHPIPNSILRHLIQRLIRTINRPGKWDEINQWLTCGYLIIARKPLAERGRVEQE